MSILLRNYCSKINIFFLTVLCKIEKVILFFIEIFSNIFEFLETILELAIFWGALFPLKFTEIKNCCIIRDAVVRVQINGSDEVLNLSKIAVDKIEEEYNKRQDSSSNKMRILFQTLSFVFAVNAAILTYILKELKQNIDIFFVLSLIFITVSLFMILIYYKVSSINKLTFPEKLDEYSIAEYLSDMLYCLDFNNKRLDFFVTVYKAALRYFIVSIIFLVFAIAKQFHTHINIFNECKPSIFVMIG